MWLVLSGGHGAVSASVRQARGCAGEACTSAPTATCWLREQELGCRVTPGACGQTRSPRRSRVFVDTIPSNPLTSEMRH